MYKVRNSTRIQQLSACPRDSGTFLTTFREISIIESTDPIYLDLRKKLCSEAYTYGRRVYPQSITLVNSVRTMLEIYGLIDYEVDQFLELLPTLAKKCRESVDSAREVNLQHSFARSRLEQLGNKANVGLESSEEGAKEIKPGRRRELKRLAGLQEL